MITLRTFAAVCLAAASALPNTRQEPLVSKPVTEWLMFYPADAASATQWIVHGNKTQAVIEPGMVTFRYPTHNLRVRLVGANHRGFLTAADPAGMVNRISESGSIAVQSWRRLECRGVYPGIDVSYGEVHGSMKSEFRVQPGASAALIRIRYEGGSRPRIIKGDLIIDTVGGVVRERRPTIYQMSAGKRISIEGGYHIAADGSVGFTAESYDRTLPLIIDPEMEFSTYWGGSLSDAVSAVAIGSDGSVYAAGWTESKDLGVHAGVQSTSRGSLDAFVLKIDSTAGTVIYATYIGGTGYDKATGIAVDGNGAAFVTGQTASVDFPMQAAYQPRLHGSKNVFLVKLDPSGSTLSFSTYLGGGGSDVANAIQVDPTGAVYLVGETNSPDFPTLKAMQPQNGGGVDAFVAKFTTTGTLLYATYLGGWGTDRARAVAVRSGEVYVAGGTDSSNFPVRSALQPTLAGGQDAFVAKFNDTGSDLVYSTYLGGSAGSASAPEEAAGIAVNTAGEAYVVGRTPSADFPKVAAIQPVYGGDLSDAFISKLSAAGTTLTYSSYIGGAGVDKAEAIALDAAENAYVAGTTWSSNFPTIDAVQSTRSGQSDCFLLAINGRDRSTRFSTFWGGSDIDGQIALAINQDTLVIGGSTQSRDLARKSAVQNWAAQIDGFLSAFSLSRPETEVTFIGADEVTAGDWQVKYGSDGYQIANDAAFLPSYAQVTMSGQQTCIWNGSTTDVRALQKRADPSDRIAPVWYANASFIIDVNLTGTETHTLALYLLDYDRGNRREIVEIIDPTTGAVLSARSESGFTGGRYLVWKIRGHVQVRLTRTGGSNAVLSGMFLGDAGVSTSAMFQGTDSTTQGLWQNAYGADGYQIVNGDISIPSYAGVSFQQAQCWTWSASTTDIRALQKSGNQSGGIASVCYAGSSFTLDLNVSDGQTHAIAFYLLDYDSTARNERIDIFDSATGALIGSRSHSGFNGGQYSVWKVRGHVQIRFTRIGGSNAVISGVFFGTARSIATRGSAASATLQSIDTTTQGTWRSRYGNSGYFIINEAAALPTYARLTPQGQQSWTWASVTTDVRALQKATIGSDRIAPVWYSSTSFTLDLDLTDGLLHTVAVYVLDYDFGQRAQTIEVTDALNGAALSTCSLSGFSGGHYLVWKMAGHVQLRFIRNGGSNAVVSGVFFED